MEEKYEEGNGPTVYIGPAVSGLKSIRNADLNVSSSSRGDDGPIEDDLLLCGRPWAIMTEERMTKIVLRYKVPHEFVCKLFGDTECIFYPNPIEVAVCKETFRTEFHLQLYIFIEHLLARYKLVSAQLCLNT